MLNLTALERDLEAKKQEGLDLLAASTTKAEAEDRLLTDEERAAIQKITDEGKALQAKIARAKGDDSMLAELNRLTDHGKKPALPSSKLLTMGEQFVSSPAYDFFKRGGHRSSAAWTSPSAELIDYVGGRSFLRAATLTEDPASGGALIQPQYLPGILPTLYKRLMIADLMADGTTDSNIVAYMQEKTFTNAAAAVAEGGVKPESALVFEPHSDPVRKIAHWLPVTEEMLEDVAQIRSYIDARLRLGVDMAEEDELLNGSGVAPHLLGLLLRPGLLTAAKVATDTNADAMFKMIMQIYATSFLMPDALVMNPADWVTTVLMKNGNGDYFTAGPFAPIQSAQMWGLPVAVTPSIVAGTGLAGAFKSASQVFRKGGIRVEASNSHQDFFIKNLVAIRAEERLALAVYRPSSFGTVTALGPVALTSRQAPAPEPEPPARGNGGEKHTR